MYAERLKQLHADVGPVIRQLIANNGRRLRSLFQRMVDSVTDAWRRGKRDTAAVEVGGTRAPPTPAGLADFLRELRAAGAERYRAFRQWLTAAWAKGIGSATTRRDRLIKTAHEVRDQASQMSREAAREALEILRPYRRELGAAWREVVRSVRQALRGRGRGGGEDTPTTEKTE